MSSSQKIKSNEKNEHNNDFTSFKTLTPFTDSILDIITLKNYLESNGTLDMAGGVEYLSQLAMIRTKFYSKGN